MGKTQKVSALNQGQGNGQGTTDGDEVASNGRRGGAGVHLGRQSSAIEPGDSVDVNEHLTRDLARVRARFAMDAPPGQPSLTSAWRSDAIVEENEAEFVDTLADCLGAGLSLQDALTCWDSGDLAAEEFDASASEDEPGAAIVPVAPRRPTGGHRLLVR